MCIIRFDMFFVLGEMNFVSERVKLFGIGDRTIVTLGRFDEIVHVDGLDIEITFYVVGERDVNHSVMLGNSFIRKVDMTISNGEVCFRMPEKGNTAPNEFSGNCFNFNEYKPDIPVDLEHLDPYVGSQIETKITKYRPKRSMRSPVKINIVLKVDIPLYHRSRRLPITHQVIVENQVKEWLQDKHYGIRISCLFGREERRY